MGRKRAAPAPPAPRFLCFSPLQLMSWSASSVTFAFTGSNITVVIDGSLASLPAAHQIKASLLAARVPFPWSAWQASAVLAVQHAGRLLLRRGRHGNAGSGALRGSVAAHVPNCQLLPSPFAHGAV